MKRVTVTLPDGLVEEIDRRETNRSRFVLEAAERELERRRRLELQRSLDRPHSESVQVAEAGMEEWGARRVTADDGLLDEAAGRAVRWTPETGWDEGSV